MRKASVRHAVAAVMFTFFANGSLIRGDVTLFEQTSIQLGNPSQSPVGAFSFDSDDPTEAPARAFDNFQLGEEQEISAVQWLGGYNFAFNPNDAFRGEIDFKLEVFANVDGTKRPDVGQSLFSTVLTAGMAGESAGSSVSKSIVPDVTASPKSNGQEPGIIVEYAADLEQPLTLPAGEYWLSIVAEQTFPSPPPTPQELPDEYVDPVWFWVLARDGDKQSYHYDSFFDRSEPGISFSFDNTFSLFGRAPLLGDFNANQVLDVDDIDLLSASIRDGSTDLLFDVTGDGIVNLDDHTHWVDELVGTLLGDTDLDKTVAFNDFVALANRFGEAGGWGNGDFNADGLVNFEDFLSLSRNFGESVEPIAAQSVPEPVMPWGLFAVAWVMVHRRRKHTK